MKSHHFGTAARRKACGLIQIAALVLVLPVAPALAAGIPEPGESGPTNLVLNVWSFADTTNWLSQGGYAPLSFTNLGASDLGAGTALVVDSPDPAWLQYNVTENDGRTNLMVDQGSVTFWFAPNWAGTNEGGAGPGLWGRLIEVGSYTTNASYGWWSIYVDPDGANLYFAAQTNDGSQAVYLSAPINWTTNRWHLVAVTYSATNSALYLDGELATNGLPVTYWPGPDVLAGGFYIGSDSSGTAQAHGMLDQVCSYANPLGAETIASTFYFASTPYYLNPDNLANFVSASSTPQLAPTFAAITGQGSLQNLGAAGNCQPGTDVWITNVVAAVFTNAVFTSSPVNLTFTIWGGVEGCAYDVFATRALKYPITNAVWGWMGQGCGCNRYALTNLPATGAWLLTGAAVDSDQDGLTDAYEQLVSHTDPAKADTSGDGMLDGWKVLWSLSGQINNAGQSSQRANYTYDPAGWLEEVAGRGSEVPGPDAEGNVFPSP